MSEPQTIVIEIDAPLDQVFPLIADPLQRRRWVEELEETVLETPEPIGPGTRFTMRIREGDDVSDYPTEVTAYEPERRFAIRMTRGPLLISVDHVLDTTVHGTRLTASVTVSAKNRLLRAAASLAGGPTRTIMERQLAKLKAVAEGAR